MTGIGIDIVEIDRFTVALKEKKQKFLLNTFSKIERSYCLGYKDPAPHFAGTFAAKEAALKASDPASRLLTEFEIRRTKTGKPEVWLDRKKSNLLVSISHTQTTACAIVLRL